MAMGMVLSVAQTLFAALQSNELRELCSKFKYESKLEKLQGTVETIKNVLLDVDSGHQELSNQSLDWVNKLKDAVYDADDLFDEFVTLAQRQKIMPGDETFVKVLSFFKKHFLFAFSTSRKIKKIREKLDNVAKDRTQFGFSDVYRPVKRKETTYSFVNEHYIIGRDEDKEVIMGMLFKESNYSSIDNVSYVSIVGIGGLGKTALAQIVYKDARIDDEFDMKLWVCVSDEFIMEEILAKLLKSATQKSHGDIGVDEVQNKLRQHIQGKKYFLVLDDLWSESRDKWLKLRAFLQVGARGSRVVVTTRSIKVAEAIGKYPMHPLQGLKDDDSWCLFETVAFNNGSREDDDDDLVDIGKDIVKKCANVPLVIRVVGSMLYGHHKREWELFQRIKLSEIMGKRENSIMPILKFSYHHLKPHLKSCFSYCAIFPKDYTIEKELLIRLWSAQGYLEPIDDMQIIEDVGEEYFSILVQRCFLQDIKHDKFGEIYSCKMHDLIHDLAQQVAGKESYFMENTSKSPIDGKTRHLADFDSRSLLLCPSDTFGKLRGLRTLLIDYSLWECESKVSTILAKCQCLRVLRLYNVSLEPLRTIKNLVHLRYLDLSSDFKLETLPESITKLYNLQVLNLSFCRNLKELPKDLRELVNLRHLDITDCKDLTYMPAGMDSMTGLRTLTRFVLGPKSSKKIQVGQLRDLMPLINLRGTLEIVLEKGYVYDSTYDSTNVGEGLYVSNKKHIKTLKIVGEEGWEYKEGLLRVNRRMLERLEPHRDLREIIIHGYKGATLPRWATTMEICLPHLVGISLFGFDSLQRLPALSQLQHLKDLTLKNMPNVEFMENDNKVVPSFPALETLCLEKCPSLKSFPRCPHVKTFELCCLNEALAFCQERDDEANATTPDASSFSTSSSSSHDNNSASGDVFDLRILKIDSFQLMKSLFKESIRSINWLTLEDDMKVESLSSVVQEYQRKYALSIDNLELRNCRKLKSMLGGGLGNLTNLKTLYIWECPKLELEEEEGFPWKDLLSLYELTLLRFPQMIDIPKGIRYLTSLRTLSIIECRNMKTYPDWLHCPKSLRSLSFYCNPRVETLPEAILPSLTSLTIFDCDGLKERYNRRNGTHFSQISHIPDLRNRL